MLMWVFTGTIGSSTTLDKILTWTVWTAVMPKCGQLSHRAQGEAHLIAVHFFRSTWLHNNLLFIMILYKCANVP